MRITIRRIGPGPALVIESADRLVADFIGRDPSAKPGGYDSRVGHGIPDRITADDITAINQTMRARSAHATWEDLVSAGRLPWLAAIAPTWDLVLLEPAMWRTVRSVVAHALAATIAKGRGLSVGTKVLHLKRPLVFPVLDGLVLQTLGATESVPAIDIVEHIRHEARQNLDGLREIQAGLPQPRSLVRILDILLWASHPAAGLSPALGHWEHLMRLRPNNDGPPPGPSAASSPVPRRPLPSSGAPSAMLLEPDPEVLRDFDAAMLEVYASAMREVRYPARRFLAMVRRRGGLEAARALLKKRGVSEGFRRVAQAGKVEITMEYQVLSDQFSPLFSEAERDVARSRLQDHGLDQRRLPKAAFDASAGFARIDGLNSPRSRGRMDDEERARVFESELRTLLPRWRQCADLGHGRVPFLIKNHGGVGAAKHLLRARDLSKGFVRLRDGGCLELTVEYLVLRREFGSLFTHEERAVARRKLTENGMRRGDLPLEPYD